MQNFSGYCIIPYYNYNKTKKRIAVSILSHQYLIVFPPTFKLSNRKRNFSVGLQHLHSSNVTA